MEEPDSSQRRDQPKSSLASLLARATQRPSQSQPNTPGPSRGVTRPAGGQSAGTQSQTPIPGSQPVTAPGKIVKHVRFSDSAPDAGYGLIQGPTPRGRRPASADLGGGGDGSSELKGGSLASLLKNVTTKVKQQTAAEAPDVKARPVLAPARLGDPPVLSSRSHPRAPQPRPAASNYSSSDESSSTNGSSLDSSSDDDEAQVSSSDGSSSNSDSSSSSSDDSSSSSDDNDGTITTANASDSGSDSDTDVDSSSASESETSSDDTPAEGAAPQSTADEVLCATSTITGIPVHILGGNKRSRKNKPGTTRTLSPQPQPQYAADGDESRQAPDAPPPGPEGPPAAEPPVGSDPQVRVPRQRRRSARQEKYEMLKAKRARRKEAQRKIRKHLSTAHFMLKAYCTAYGLPVPPHRPARTFLRPGEKYPPFLGPEAVRAYPSEYWDARFVANTTVAALEEEHIRMGRLARGRQQGPMAVWTDLDDDEDTALNTSKALTAGAPLPPPSGRGPLSRLAPQAATGTDAGAAGNPPSRLGPHSWRGRGPEGAVTAGGWHWPYAARPVPYGGADRRDAGVPSSETAGGTESTAPGAAAGAAAAGAQVSYKFHIRRVPEGLSLEQMRALAAWRFCGAPKDAPARPRKRPRTMPTPAAQEPSAAVPTAQAPAATGPTVTTAPVPTAPAAVPTAPAPAAAMPFPGGQAAVPPAAASIPTHPTSAGAQGLGPPATPLSAATLITSSAGAVSALNKFAEMARTAAKVGGAGGAQALAAALRQLAGVPPPAAGAAEEGVSVVRVAHILAAALTKLGAPAVEAARFAASLTATSSAALSGLVGPVAAVLMRDAVSELSGLTGVLRRVQQAAALTSTQSQRALTPPPSTQPRNAAPTPPPPTPLSKTGALTPPPPRPPQSAEGSQIKLPEQYKAQLAKWEKSRRDLLEEKRTLDPKLLEYVEQKIAECRAGLAEAERRRQEQMQLMQLETEEGRKQQEEQQKAKEERRQRAEERRMRKEEKRRKRLEGGPPHATDAPAGVAAVAATLGSTGGVPTGVRGARTRPRDRNADGGAVGGGVGVGDVQHLGAGGHGAADTEEVDAASSASSSLEEAGASEGDNEGESDAGTTAAVSAVSPVPSSSSSSGGGGEEASSGWSASSDSSASSSSGSDDEADDGGKHESDGEGEEGASAARELGPGGSSGSARVAKKRMVSGDAAAAAEGAAGRESGRFSPRQQQWRNRRGQKAVVEVVVDELRTVPDPSLDEKVDPADVVALEPAHAAYNDTFFWKIRTRCKCYEWQRDGDAGAQTQAHREAAAGGSGVPAGGGPVQHGAQELQAGEEPQAEAGPAGEGGGVGRGTSEGGDEGPNRVEDGVGRRWRRCMHVVDTLRCTHPGCRAVKRVHRPAGLPRYLPLPELMASDVRVWVVRPANRSRQHNHAPPGGSAMTTSGCKGPRQQKEEAAGRQPLSELHRLVPPDLDADMPLATSLPLPLPPVPTVSGFSQLPATAPGVRAAAAVWLLEPPPPPSWRCRGRVWRSDPDKPRGWRLSECGTLTEAGATDRHTCSSCGALRPDGPTGRLRQLVAEALNRLDDQKATPRQVYDLVRRACGDTHDIPPTPTPTSTSSQQLPPSWCEFSLQEVTADAYVVLVQRLALRLAAPHRPPDPPRPPRPPERPSGPPADPGEVLRQAIQATGQYTWPGLELLYPMLPLLTEPDASKFIATVDDFTSFENGLPGPVGTGPEAADVAGSVAAANFAAAQAGHMPHGFATATTATATMEGNEGVEPMAFYGDGPQQEGGAPSKGRRLSLRAIIRLARDKRLAQKAARNNGVGEGNVTLEEALASANADAGREGGLGPRPGIWRHLGGVLDVGEGGNWHLPLAFRRLRSAVATAVVSRNALVSPPSADIKLLGMVGAEAASHLALGLMRSLEWPLDVFTAGAGGPEGSSGGGEPSAAVRAALGDVQGVGGTERGRQAGGLSGAVSLNTMLRRLDREVAACSPQVSALLPDTLRYKRTVTTAAAADPGPGGRLTNHCTTTTTTTTGGEGSLMWDGPAELRPPLELCGPQLHRPDLEPDHVQDHPIGMPYVVSELGKRRRLDPAILLPVPYLRQQLLASQRAAAAAAATTDPSDSSTTDGSKHSVGPPGSLPWLMHLLRQQLHPEAERFGGPVGQDLGHYLAATGPLWRLATAARGQSVALSAAVEALVSGGAAAGQTAAETAVRAAVMSALSWKGRGAKGRTPASEITGPAVVNGGDASTSGGTDAAVTAAASAAVLDLLSPSLTDRALGARALAAMVPGLDVEVLPALECAGPALARAAVAPPAIRPMGHRRPMPRSTINQIVLYFVPACQEAGSATRTWGFGSRGQSDKVEGLPMGDPWGRFARDAADASNGFLDAARTPGRSWTKQLVERAEQAASAPGSSTAAARQYAWRVWVEPAPSPMPSPRRWESDGDVHMEEGVAGAGVKGGLSGEQERARWNGGSKPGPDAGTHSGGDRATPAPAKLPPQVVMLFQLAKVSGLREELVERAAKRFQALTARGPPVWMAPPIVANVEQRPVVGAAPAATVASGGEAAGGGGAGAYG